MCTITLNEVPGYGNSTLYITLVNIKDVKYYKIATLDELIKKYRIRKPSWYNKYKQGQLYSGVQYLGKLGIYYDHNEISNIKQIEVLRGVYFTLGKRSIDTLVKGGFLTQYHIDKYGYNHIKMQSIGIVYTDIEGDNHYERVTPFDVMLIDDTQFYNPRYNLNVY